MNYRLDHVAIRCEDLNGAVEFYQRLFGGTPTEVRKGSAGYRFCFVKINGAAAIQLMESKERAGVHHYGFVTDDVEGALKDFEQKGVKVLRQNRDPSGKLTTIFLEDPNGLEIEVRLPR